MLVFLRQEASHTNRKKLRPGYDVLHKQLGNDQISGQVWERPHENYHILSSSLDFRNCSLQQESGYV